MGYAIDNRQSVYGFHNLVLVTLKNTLYKFKQSIIAYI